MRKFLGGILTVLCLKFLFVPAASPPGRSISRKCSLSDCVTYGGPNDMYSVRPTAPAAETRSGGWIVGEIRAFAFGADNSGLVRSLAGNGWVECAGQLIDGKDFPEAAAALEDTWGSQDPNRTQVYLPDLRGLVLRGWHHGRHPPQKYPFSPYSGDADLGGRVFPRPELLDLPEPGLAGPTDPNTKQVIKDHVGSMQAEQFHGHRHNFSFVAGNGAIQVRRKRNSSVTAPGEPVRIGGSTEFEGGNETHPPNAYVLYLIYLGRSAYEPPASEEDQRLGKPRRVTTGK
jgi:hypothetical protein